jgi:hypothetical protein
MVLADYIKGLHLQRLKYKLSLTVHSIDQHVTLTETVKTLKNQKPLHGS